MCITSCKNRNICFFEVSGHHSAMFVFQIYAGAFARDVELECYSRHFQNRSGYHFKPTPCFLPLKSSKSEWNDINIVPQRNRRCRSIKITRVSKKSFVIHLACELSVGRDIR